MCVAHIGTGTPIDDMHPTSDLDTPESVYQQTLKHMWNKICVMTPQVQWDFCFLIFSIVFLSCSICNLNWQRTSLLYNHLILSS